MTYIIIYTVKSVKPKPSLNKNPVQIESKIKS